MMNSGAPNLRNQHYLVTKRIRLLLISFVHKLICGDVPFGAAGRFKWII
jgi:hypothetical protein